VRTCTRWHRYCANVCSVRTEFIDYRALAEKRRTEILSRLIGIVRATTQLKIVHRCGPTVGERDHMMEFEETLARHSGRPLQQMHNGLHPEPTLRVSPPQARDARAHCKAVVRVTDPSASKPRMFGNLDEARAASIRPYDACSESLRHWVQYTNNDE
jgi:hypothetical protein